MKNELLVLSVLLFSFAGGRAVVTGGFCHNCATHGVGDLELNDNWPLCTNQDNAGNPMCVTSARHEPEITRRDSVISLDDLYRGNYGYEKNMNNNKHVVLY